MHSGKCQISFKRRSTFFASAFSKSKMFSDNDFTKWLSIWLIGDLNTVKGRTLLNAGLKALKKSSNLRLAYLHNGEIGTRAAGFDAVQLITSIIAHQPGTIAKQMLNKLLNEDTLEQVLKSQDLEKISVHVSFSTNFNTNFF